MTRAPSRTSASAMAYPIPAVLPLTSASFPLSPRSISLFRAPRESLSNHVDLVNRLRVIPHALGSSVLLAVRRRHARALRVKHLLAGSGKRHARRGPRHGNNAQVFSFHTEHLNTRITGGDVQTTFRVDSHPIATGGTL